MTNRYALRASLLTLLLACFVPGARAETILLASVGTAANPNQYSSLGDTIPIEPNVLWAAPLPGSFWISYAPSGNHRLPGYYQVPNDTVVSFFDLFFVPGIATAGSITVMADDGAAVFLNGVLLLPEGLSEGNTYATCSDFGIGCLNGVPIELPVSLIETGWNTLEFRVRQAAGSSFGLNYAGYVEDPVPTSEPGSLLFSGLGLLALAGFARRKAASPTTT